MRHSILVVLCSTLAISEPGFAQESDVQPGYIAVNDERGRPVARVTDPQSNNTLAVSCPHGTLDLEIRYGALSMQNAPTQDQGVTVVFASRGGTVEVPATSRPGEGLVVTSSDEETHKGVRDALRSFSAMTSDDVGTVTINDEQGQGIGTIAVSGKGTTRAYGKLMQGCRG